MAELRKLDLSCIESARTSGMSTPTEEKHLPLLDLYSIIVASGRFSTLRIVSLDAVSQHGCCRVAGEQVAPDRLSHLCLVRPVPYAHDVLALPHTDSAAADLWPFSRLRVGLVIELVADNGKDQVFPDTVCDTFLQTNDPFSAREIQRVFPDWPAHGRVEQQIIGGRLELRRWMEMSPQGPVGLDLRHNISYANNFGDEWARVRS